MRYTYLVNELYEVLESKNGDCIVKEKVTNKYFFKKKYFASQKYKFDSVSQIRWSIKDTVYIILVVISIICLIFTFYNYDLIYNNKYRYTGELYLYSVIYLLIIIVVHEISHYLVLKLYGRQAGKIRFKLYYHVFPTITTDTTDSYMLPRYRRAFVYYAGIMSGWIICGVTLLLLPNYSYNLRVVVWMIIYNMIPFGGIKTDGYHIIINSFLNIKDLKNKKNIIAEITKYIFFVFAIISFIDSIARIYGARL